METHPSAGLGGRPIDDSKRENSTEEGSKQNFPRPIETVLEHIWNSSKTSAPDILSVGTGDYFKHFFWQN